MSTTSATGCVLSIYDNCVHGVVFKYEHNIYFFSHERWAKILAFTFFLVSVFFTRTCKYTGTHAHTHTNISLVSGVWKSGAGPRALETQKKIRTQSRRRRWRRRPTVSFIAQLQVPLHSNTHTHTHTDEKHILTLTHRTTLTERAPRENPWFMDAVMVRWCVVQLRCAVAFCGCVCVSSRSDGVFPN